MAPNERRRLGSLSVENAIDIGFLSIGEHTYGNPSITAFPGDTAKVKIGRYCSLADGAEFFVGGNHRTDWVTTYPLRVMLDLPGALLDGHPATKGEIVVGNDVWVGADAKILSGVTIGNGAVIGLGAVVATDVRPYAIVAGNPAREVRRRFPDQIVDALQQIAWWDWPSDVVRERVEDLCNPDLQGFVRRYSTK